MMLHFYAMIIPSEHENAMRDPIAHVQVWTFEECCA